MAKQRKTAADVVDLDGASRRGSAPAARYADPAFLELERERVFARSWLVAGLSYRVANRGDYLTFDELGQSVLIIRDKAGVLHAFHNTCRHRGTRLLDGSGCVKAIRCPYHDWKYSLDGRLKHVPGQEGFSVDIDKSERSLLPVHVDEALGFVWLNFSESPEPLAASLGATVSEIAPYRLEEMRPIQEVTWTLDCNWKAVLDNATESYHIPMVHGGSVDPLTEDVPDFVTFGDHYRLSLSISDYGWRRAVDRVTSRGGPYTARQMSALQKYVFFPNFLVNLIPCHLTVFQVWPIDAQRCRFFYGFYGREGANPIEWLRSRATWMASRYILREDKAILARFQRGAQAGHIQAHEFHTGEVAIDHYHRVLDRWITTQS